MTLDLSNRVSALRRRAAGAARHARVVALLRLSSLAALARDAAAHVFASLRLSSLTALARDATRRVVPMLGYQVVPTVAALALLVVCMGGRWRLASASPKASTLTQSASPRPPLTQAHGAVDTMLLPRGTAGGSASSASSPARSPPSSTSHGASGSPAGGVAFDDGAAPRPVKKSGKDLSGTLNLNTATEDQLMLLPTVGPAKAERIVTWRKKNGGFRRTADLRRVKGFGYKTFKRLEPWLAITGDTTLR